MQVPMSGLFSPFAQTHSYTSAFEQTAWFASKELHTHMVSLVMRMQLFACKPGRHFLLRQKAIPHPYVETVVAGKRKAVCEDLDTGSAANTAYSSYQS